MKPDRECRTFSEPIPRSFSSLARTLARFRVYMNIVRITWASRLLASRRTVYAKTYSGLYTGIPGTLTIAITCPIRRSPPPPICYGNLSSALNVQVLLITKYLDIKKENQSRCQIFQCCSVPVDLSNCLTLIRDYIRIYE